MITAGIDIGGTKIEVQLFDANWTKIAHQRVATPASYHDLVQAVADQIAWADARAGAAVPVGIGAAGLVHPVTGLISAANLAASGRPFPSDINSVVGRDMVYLNDCRAMALSESVFGAGRDHAVVAALILGTGVGGGLALNGTLCAGPTQTGGEFGHMSAPAHLIAEHNLPIHTCGCGRSGCIETYISGPGLTRLAQNIANVELGTVQITARRNSDMHHVWTIWCDLVGDLLHRLTLTVDPDIIVVGGGLSRIDNLIADLQKVTQAQQFDGFDIAPLALAQGGDSSGARGAAYAAWQAQTDG